MKPGLTGAHLLITDTPRVSAPTMEQRIRGSDAAADWIVLISGYDSGVVQEAASSQLSAPALPGIGLQETIVMGCYGLAFTMTPLDLASA